MPLKNRKHMTPDLTSLPEGQRRAVRALISGERARTYPEAAKLEGMSLVTLYTHLRRVKGNHPEVYKIGLQGQESPACCATPQPIRQRQGSHQGLVQEGEAE